MKNSILKILVTSLYSMVLLSTSLLAFEYPSLIDPQEKTYKQLSKRVNDIKIYYTKNGAVVTCRVKVKLVHMIWESAEHQVKNETPEVEPLFQCLPKEKAEWLLLQSFLQFGRGL